VAQPLLRGVRNPDLGAATSLRGREERILVKRRWRSDWGEFRYEPDELLDLGDRVLVLGRMIGTGPGSGATLDTEWAALITLSQGQIVREQVYFNRGEALEAAGLREYERGAAAAHCPFHAGSHR
jgi:ketosteroid isomerase-like protein